MRPTSSHQTGKGASAPSPGSGPDPSQVADLGEFVDVLARLRVWAGNPSYRTLAKRVGPLLRPPRALSHTTLAHAFQPGRRRIDLDMVLAIVRALNLDELSVGRWRAAWFRVTAKTGTAAGVLRQLPADLATFTGRTGDLARLVELTAAAESGTATTVVISAIDGMAGVGKTQLAIHAAHMLVRAGRYNDAQLYVNLRGFDGEQPPVDPPAVLEEFLRQLGVPARQIPEGTDARAAMFRDRTHDKDALILLDNAADERQVRDLIPAGPGCLVLITSRRVLAGLDGANLWSLDAFSSGEALDLLARIVGADRVAAEPGAAAQVVAQCRFLPLAVALVAARLRSRPSWSLADLSERLEDQMRLLDELATGGRGIAAAFALSYQNLTDEQRRMFRFLSLHPGADFDAGAAAALAGSAQREAERLLEDLLDANLLQQRAVGRYGLHDLLRVYARDQLRAQTPEPHWTAATTRLLAYYLATAANAERLLNPARQELSLDPATETCSPLEFTDQASAWQWCDTEYANLQGAIRLAADTGCHTIAWQLPVVLSVYFRHRAHRHDWLAVLHIGLESAETLNDRAAQSWVVARLAIACNELGLLHQGLEHFTRLLDIQEQSGDKNGEQATLTNRAVTHMLLDQPEKAVEGLERALRIQRLTENRSAQGVTLANLGKVHLRMGRFAQAVMCCEDAIAVYRDTGQDQMATNALNTIGEAHRGLGLLTEAEAFHRRALASSREHGSRNFEAASLTQLGHTLRQRGDLATAVESFRQAHAIYGDIGDPAARDVLALIHDCEGSEGVPVDPQSR